MTLSQNIREHMDVICADGHHHGQVDHLDGEYLKLTRDAQGQHHWLPLSTVDHVDEHVHLNLRHEEVASHLLSQDPHPEHRQ
ncbi:DUF2171 domain-containing protein [Deinococcus maricopensis]|uniref:DUF2171 domain-containing protein n=1 Tax=Deinococcus maricopensis (strain DSM 21211 / LMG 22137 / NRRL B-23946 / LB-34) TaxID=709986 RepID=E8U4C3_DEIML|nr:DUF2171 domain-containing protein [Deinococcus maricopensis]ADV65960.1 Protein of unknown function DUF2171 [Deinococcus maricopensis DSM 21211]